MRQYELMLVLVPEFDATDEKKAGELVKLLVGNATVQSLAMMGKKRLAYPIRKQTEGLYVLVRLTANEMKTSDVERQTQLGTDVLRFLLTVKE
ncbi:30S ribosomal protein S6 [Candidatus Gottesmanbacteria bacterium]|nr:30S ribosomal protein S6 [Candidatus Gottesmanbacteria bacterium]